MSDSTLRMVMFAQEATQNSVLLVVLAASAVAIAVLALVWTLIQGRQIRRIDRREHEWQEEARKSAWIHATVRTRRRVRRTEDDKLARWNESYLTLTNTGQASARNVDWSVGPDGPEIPQTGVPILHPGESFDLSFDDSQIENAGWTFVVEWEDGHDAKRSNERTIQALDTPARRDSQRSTGKR